MLLLWIALEQKLFFGELTNTNPNTLKGKISVIGGHSGDTIVPLINYNKLVGLISSKSQYDEFVHRVQFGGDEVVKAKNGAGSATLSMAYAGYRFAEYVIDSLSGRLKNEPVPDSAYIYLPGISGGKEFSNAHLQGVDFFSVPVFLSNGEISSFIDPFKSLTVTNDEKKLIEVALKGLKGSIDQGVQFVDASKL